MIFCFSRYTRPLSLGSNSLVAASGIFRSIDVAIRRCDMIVSISLWAAVRACIRIEWSDTGESVPGSLGRDPNTTNDGTRQSSFMVSSIDFTAMKRSMASARK